MFHDFRGADVPATPRIALCGVLPAAILGLEAPARPIRRFRPTQTRGAMEHMTAIGSESAGDGALNVDGDNS